MTYKKSTIIPMNSIQYSDFPELKGIYLEDSFVLEINITHSSIIFVLEAVLTEEQPSYHEPLPNEQYCFRKAELAFLEAEKVEWISKKMHPFTDANGDIDYGNIDKFFVQDMTYHLEGDWGEVNIKASGFSFQIK
jgi:hypothetical protein